MLQVMVFPLPITLWGKRNLVGKNGHLNDISYGSQRKKKEKAD